MALFTSKMPKVKSMIDIPINVQAPWSISLTLSAGFTSDVVNNLDGQILDILLRDRRPEERMVTTVSNWLQDFVVDEIVFVRETNHHGGDFCRGKSYKITSQDSVRY